MRKLLSIIIIVVMTGFTLAQNEAYLLQKDAAVTSASINQTAGIGINKLYKIGGPTNPALQDAGAGGSNLLTVTQGPGAYTAQPAHELSLSQVAGFSNTFVGSQLNTYRDFLVLDQMAGGSNEAYTDQTGDGSRTFANIKQNAGVNNLLDLDQKVIGPLNNTNFWEVYSRVDQWATGSNTLLIHQEGRDIDQGETAFGNMDAVAGNNYAKLEQFGRHEDMEFNIYGTDNTLYMYQEVSGGTVDFIKADVFQYSDGTNYGKTRQVGGGELYLEADQSSSVSNYLDMNQVGRDISADVWQNSTAGFNSAITSQTVDNATINSTQTGAGNNILNVVQN